MDRYFIKFHKTNNRFYIYESLTRFVVLWYKDASIAYNKLLELEKAA